MNFTLRKPARKHLIEFRHDQKNYSKPWSSHDFDPLHYKALVFTESMCSLCYMKDTFQRLRNQ